MLVLLAPLLATALKASANLKASELTVGRTVIPTLARRWESSDAFIEKRTALFAAGLYPGVDYEILEAQPEDGTVTVKPIYRLDKKYERTDCTAARLELTRSHKHPPASHPREFDSHRCRSTSSRRSNLLSASLILCALL